MYNIRALKKQGFKTKVPYPFHKNKVLLKFDDNFRFVRRYLHSVLFSKYPRASIISMFLKHEER